MGPTEVARGARIKGLAFESPEHRDRRCTGICKVMVCSRLIQTSPDAYGINGGCSYVFTVSHMHRKTKVEFLKRIVVAV